MLFSVCFKIDQKPYYYGKHPSKYELETELLKDSFKKSPMSTDHHGHGTFYHSDFPGILFEIVIVILAKPTERGSSLYSFVQGKISKKTVFYESKRQRLYK